MNERHREYIQFLESMEPQSLDRLGEYVAEDVRFIDPFNDVCGLQAMHAIFRHMFDAVGPLRFEVTHSASNGRTLHLGWRFSARLRGQPWSFDGTSLVTFDDAGMIVSHLDFWDAGAAFYERLPIIGWLLRKVRRRIAHG